MTVVLRLPLIAALAGVLSAACAPAEDNTPAQASPREESPQTRTAVFASGRLWLHADRTDLWSVDPAVRAARREALPTGEPVLGLCAQDGDLVAVTGAGPTAPTYTLLKRTTAGWSTLAAIPSQGEPFAALACGPGGPTLVTSRRLLTATATGVRAVPLAATPKLPLDNLLPDTVTLLTPTELFIGFDNGEWGGGVWRIDRADGRIVALGQKATGEDICGKPLDSDCDSITGLTPAPGAPDCLVAFVSITAPWDHGGLLRLCGARIESLYPGPGADQSFVGGLVPAGDGVLAISAAGLTQVAPGAEPVTRPLPAFETYGPFEISFAEPRAAIVRYTYWNGGDWNWRIAAVAAR